MEICPKLAVQRVVCSKVRVTSHRVRVMPLGLGFILLWLGSEDVSRQRLDQNAKFLAHFDPLISLLIARIFTEFTFAELYVRKEPWGP